MSSEVAAKMKPQYPDYLDDPDGLDRFRQSVRVNSGHDMALVNYNSLGRLIDTIDRLTRQQAEARATSGAGDRERLTDKVRDLIAEMQMGDASEYETTDVIVALLSASPTEVPGLEGVGSVTISRERYDRLRFAAGEINADPGLAAVAGESRSALMTAMATERRAFAAPTRLALNEQGEG
jgi:hypothetical protein